MPRSAGEVEPREPTRQSPVGVDAPRAVPTCSSRRLVCNEHCMYLCRCQKSTMFAVSQPSHAALSRSCLRITSTSSFRAQSISAHPPTLSMLPGRPLSHPNTLSISVAIGPRLSEPARPRGRSPMALALSGLLGRGASPRLSGHIYSRLLRGLCVPPDALRNGSSMMSNGTAREAGRPTPPPMSL